MSLPKTPGWALAGCRAIGLSQSEAGGLVKVWLLQRSPRDVMVNGSFKEATALFEGRARDALVKAACSSAEYGAPLISKGPDCPWSWRWPDRVTPSDLLLEVLAEDRGA